MSLPYIIRETVDVTPESSANPNVTYDPCLPDKAHGASSYVLKDLILCTAHYHPLYKQDNAAVLP